MIMLELVILGNYMATNIVPKFKYYGNNLWLEMLQYNHRLA